jgi:hypothetical protein
MYKSGRSRERADPNTVPSSIRYFADREDKPDFSETVAGSSKDRGDLLHQSTTRFTAVNI